MTAAPMRPASGLSTTRTGVPSSEGLKRPLSRKARRKVPSSSLGRILEAMPPGDQDPAACDHLEGEIASLRPVDRNEQIERADAHQV
jgi:hypothetical protein